MKHSKWLLLIFIAALTISCKTEKMMNYTQYTGILKATGITSYQYGTHTLESGEDFFALRSAAIDLTSFEDKQVRLWAEKIEGYPVDGGPIYLEVKKVALP